MTTRRRRRKLSRALIVKDNRSGDYSILKADRRESKQISEALKGLYNDSGVQRPPYAFDQLAALLTSSTAHYRACRQKASDTAGLGWSLAETEDTADAAEGTGDEERARLTRFFNDPNPQDTLRQVLEAVAFDYEAIGWGFLELVLNAKGDLQEVNHIPAHTMRAHKDGTKFVQVRGSQKVWFIDVAHANPWDTDPDSPQRFINSTTGEITEEAPDDSELGNPVIPFVNYTPLSSFYGLPDYIPAIGAMASNVAIRDFNLGYVSHNTVPQYAVVVQGAELGEEFEEEIMAYFRDHVQGTDRATLVLPIPYGKDEVTVTFERLASDVSGGGFLDLKDSNTVEILIAHGIPPYRVAWAIMGSLGGNLGKEMNEVYKDAIIESRQEVIESRVNRYIVRGALKATRYEWKLADIDLTDKTADLQLAVTSIEYGLLTPAEAREDILGKEADGASTEFWMASSLVRVDDPTPTPDEQDAAEMKRLRRDVRSEMVHLRDATAAVRTAYEDALKARRESA